MALVRVVTTTGETILVHTSAFDRMKIVDAGPRPAVATGSWADVWAKSDGQAPANTGSDRDEDAGR